MAFDVRGYLTELGSSPADILEYLRKRKEEEQSGKLGDIGLPSMNLPQLSLPSVDLGFRGPQGPQGPSVGLPQPTMPQPTVDLPQPTVGLPSIDLPKMGSGKYGLPGLPELNLPELNVGLPEEIKKALEAVYPGFKQDESGKYIFNPDTGEAVDMTTAIGKLSGQDWLSKLGADAKGVLDLISKPVETGLSSIGLGNLSSLISPVSMMYGGANLVKDLLDLTTAHSKWAKKREDDKRWNKVNEKAVDDYSYQDDKTGDAYRLGNDLQVFSLEQNSSQPLPSGGWVKITNLPKNQYQGYYRPIEKWENGKWVNISDQFSKNFDLDRFKSGDMFGRKIDVEPRAVVF